ncbi:gluconokinase [Georgenia subflava]|uniref:Sugar kinase n=1 Tax=Georgenia subflava TaxID=1622177 RepID=A0A6N7EBV7_9MICO|nr:gluconokinase [Georgenia subflava]MPV35902.1 sugar kinase [Georgenia subflava]
MGEFRVELEDAVDPLVLAVDIGSTASRGGIYDASGRPVHRLGHKVPHAFTTHADGTSVVDPDAVLAEVEEILTILARRDLAGRIAGVALDTFASSLVGVDRDGRPLTPCYTYADSRCADQVTALRAELDESDVQQRTGTRLHSSYLPARLRWLRETEPETFGRVSRWLSLGEYLYDRILGTTAVGTSTAAWTGLLDRRTGTWDDTMLAVAGIDAAQLSEIRDPDRPLTGVAARWPALRDATWFPVITDGLAANIGAGAEDATTAVVSAATSGAIRVLVADVPDQLPSGLWCYRVSASHSLLGGALNDVGRAVSWLGSTLRLDGVDLAAVLAADPDPGTPAVLPYLSGERSTGWAAGARAMIADISAATTPATLFRATMEGVALSYARVAEELREVAGPPRRILAGGRVTQDHPAWLQVLADAIGAPVVPVTIKRSTLHGTALVALAPLAPDVPRAPVLTGPTSTPAEGRAPYYAARAGRYRELYEAVIGKH